MSARDLRFRSGFFTEVHCGLLSVAGPLVYICAPVGRYQGDCLVLCRFFACASQGLGLCVLAFVYVLSHTLQTRCRHT